MDINTRIAQYLQNHTEANINDITAALKDASCNYSELQNSIFQIGDGISEEEFIQYMSETTGKDAESIRDSASLLFDILNAEDSTDGLLTSDELDFISGNGETFSGFDLWNSTFFPDENRITDYMQPVSSDGTSSASSSQYEEYGSSPGENDTGVGTGETSGTSSTNGTDSASGAAAASSSSASTSSSSSSSGIDLSDPASIKSLLETYMEAGTGISTYNQAIEFLADTLGWSSEDVEQIKTTLLYDGLSSEDKAKVDKLVEAGLSYSEAMQKLSDKGAITVDESILDKEVEEVKQEEKSLSDAQIEVFVDQLYDSMDGLGTDDEQFESILNNQNISDDDWVRIINKYNEKYGSFISDVDGDFSFMSGKEDKMNAIADKLIRAAENGNEDAIEALCKEFHNGTAGQKGTADEFIARIMETASDKVLGQLVIQYGTYNDGASIFKDVKGDFSFGREDDYIAKLNNAFSLTYEEDDK